MKAKCIIASLLLVSAIILLTSCDGDTQVSSDQVANSLQTSDNENSDNSQMDNSKTNEYSYQEVNFEVNTKCEFLQGSETGVIYYLDKNGDSNYGLIDSSGKILLEPTYDGIRPPREGICVVKNQDESLFLADENGKKIADVKSDYKFQLATGSFTDCRFKEGYVFLPIKNDSENQYVCVDKNGNVVFETGYSSLSDFTNGVSVGLDRPESNVCNVVAIDTKGNTLWSVQVEAFPEKSRSPKITDGLIVYMDSDSKLYGAVDINGKQTLECKYEELSFAGDGLIGVYKYGAWGYMDYNGNIVIEPQFSEVKEFIDGQAIVKEGDKKFVIDKKGNKLFGLGDICSQYENGLYSDYYYNDSNFARLLNHDGSEIYSTECKALNYDGVQYGISYNGGSVFYRFEENSGTKKYNFFKLIKN